MADVPQDLLQQIKELEELFTVDTAKLKQIVDHFVKELEKGASRCKPLPRVVLDVLEPYTDNARSRSQRRGRQHRELL